jgi:uncharacterized repeat protein (TIGR03803 family)
MVDAGGVLYGATTNGGGSCAINAGGCGTIYRIAKDGTYSVIYRFTGGADGAYPGELTLDSSGNIYGVAQRAGEVESGVVFKITP